MLGLHSEPPFAELTALFEKLIQKNEGKGSLNALDLDKALRKLPYSVPVWFKGVLRASAKLKAKTSLDLNFISTTELAEMSSSESVSRHRFKSVSNYLDDVDFIYMPTCGAGMDVIHLVTNYPQVKTKKMLLNDIDPLALNMCRYNLGLLPGIPEWDGVEGDFLDDSKVPFSGYCYLDPSRRRQQKRFEKNEYAPPLQPSMKILEKFDLSQIKLSPGEELLDLKRNHPGWRFELLEYGNEIKEVNGLWLKKSADRSVEDAGLVVTRLCKQEPGLESWAVSEQSTLRGEGRPEPGAYCYIPSVALRQSRCMEIFAAERGFLISEGSDSFLLDTRLRKEPLVTGYKILDVQAGHAKGLKVLRKNYGEKLSTVRAIGRVSTKVVSAIESWVRRNKKNEALTALCYLDGKAEKVLILEPQDGLRN